MNNDSTVIDIDPSAKNGQDKCPKCGATDIELNVKTGMLRCNFCRTEFPAQTVTNNTNISELSGVNISTGASDINESSDNGDMITLKCSSCGAEVVIDTSSTTQARCHWCRNYLSINEKVPNGAVPDLVLPFSVTKDEARGLIEGFVSKRKFYANPKFKEEFTTENIMGVYFPYMLVDINAHAKFSGEGEHLVRRYTRGNGDSSRIYYDADLYNVEREFDIAINGLTIESSLDKLVKNSNKTNNVINAIMPFDTENSVKFNSNYLRGYTSEKRDVNVEELQGIVNAQARDISKFSVNNTLENYDRGVAWKGQDVNMIGSEWKAEYLPVWLYSYMEKKGSSQILHYVAVNARTKETMGSIPLYMPKLLGVSFVIELFGMFLMLLIDFDYSFLFLSIGFIYFFYIYFKYRNTNARHKYETETKNEVSNLRKVDTYIMKRTGLSNAKIIGCNNTSTSSDTFSNKVINNLIDNNEVASFISKNIKK